MDKYIHIANIYSFISHLIRIYKAPEEERPFLLNILENWLYATFKWNDTVELDLI